MTQLSTLSSSSPLSPNRKADEAATRVRVPAVRRARINFRGRFQGTEESVEEYTDALELLAAQCGYTSVVLDEQLKDQFLFGLKSMAVQDKLCEEDGNVTMEKLIDIAAAAETFQAERFGFQHPLSTEQIQTLVTPYLDGDALFSMRLVSKSSQYFIDEELARRQRRIIRENRWSPVPFDSNTELDNIFGRYSLCLSSPIKILEFIKMFGENVTSSTSWPFFGEGVVQLRANYEEVTKCGAGFCSSVTRFLELFGSEITVLIWRNGSQPICTLDKKLKLVPNLTDLWVEGFFSPNDDIERSKWPKLTHLRSIRVWRLDDEETTNGWQADHLVHAYGSQLTALNIGNSLLSMSDLIMEHPSDRNLLLSNVRDFSILNSIESIRGLGEYPDWKLKRLSLHVSTTTNFSQDEAKFKKFDKYVSKSQIVWNLINQSRESLEEVHINIDSDWEDFVQLFLLPVFHKPGDRSVQSSKVRKLTIPAMSLLRAKQVAGVVRKRFPNVQQLQFNNWDEHLPGAYEDFMDDKQNMELGESLPRWARDLYFNEVHFTDKMSVRQLPREILDYFWNDMASLKEITVLKYSHNYRPEQMVYSEIRN